MKKILLVMFVVLLSASLAYAAGGKVSECKACANAKSSTGASAMGGRLCQGICNTALGWTEIFFRPGKEVAAGNNPLVGFFKGLGNAIARTGAGAVEIVTFWVPGDQVAMIDSCPLCAYK